MERVKKGVFVHRIGLVAVVGVCGAIAMSGIAAAKWNVFRVGNLVFKADARLMPRALPRDEFAPSSFRARARIATADRTHPPAMREGIVYIDRDGRLDAHGLPACSAGELEARDTKAAKRACGDAIVGTGTGTAELAFAEQDPLLVESPVILFNGGVRGGTTTLFFHAFIDVPVPAAIVTTLKLRSVRAGRYGTRGVIKVPRIVGGIGSVVAVDFKLERTFDYKGRKKSYDQTRCPDGHIDLKGVGIFKDEVGEGGETRVSASLALPCVPKR